MEITFKQYKAIRRVSRLEYLLVVLRNVAMGYLRENAQRDVQKIQTDLEANKAKALGRKKARPVSGGAVLNESEKMALQLRFMERHPGSLALTSDGEKLLRLIDMEGKSRLSDEARAMLIARFWQVYPIFSQTILAIYKQPNGEMALPMPTDLDFEKTIQRHYDFGCDAVSFKIIREIGTELGLLNWYIREEIQNRLQCVYAISCITTLKELEKGNSRSLDSEVYSDNCPAKMTQEIGNLVTEKDELLNINLGTGKVIILNERKKCICFAALNDHYLIIPYQELTINQFEEQLWKMYLEVVNYRPLFPVVYPEMRNRLCHRLRMSDEVFDQSVIELIKNPGRIRIYPSTGILDYSRNLAQLHKHLPPQNKAGQFITFLKITRVKQDER